MKTRHGNKHLKGQLLRAAEHRLLLEEMLHAVAAFKLRSRARQNRRTTPEL